MALSGEVRLLGRVAAAAELLIRGTGWLVFSFSDGTGKSIQISTRYCLSYRNPSPDISGFLVSASHSRFLDMDQALWQILHAVCDAALCNCLLSAVCYNAPHDTFYCRSCHILNSEVKVLAALTGAA